MPLSPQPRPSPPISRHPALTSASPTRRSTPRTRGRRRSPRTGHRPPARAAASRGHRRRDRAGRVRQRAGRRTARQPRRGDRPQGAAGGRGEGARRPKPRQRPRPRQPGSRAAAAPSAKPRRGILLPVRRDPFRRRRGDNSPAGAQASAYAMFPATAGATTSSDASSRCGTGSRAGTTRRTTARAVPTASRRRFPAARWAAPVPTGRRTPPPRSPGVSATSPAATARPAARGRTRSRPAGTDPD